MILVPPALWYSYFARLQFGTYGGSNAWLDMLKDWESLLTLRYWKLIFWIRFVKKNPHDIAAIIIEPIQGEGGDNHFRNEFMVSLRNICNENDLLLIFDEVQTGIGITGKI